MNLTSTTLASLVDQTVSRAQANFSNPGQAQVVVSPYRFNPLGAHIDHQGGEVMARTIDQYTVLAFYPSDDQTVRLCHGIPDAKSLVCEFKIGETVHEENWARYAQASVATLVRHIDIKRGFSGAVQGTLVGAGLSSSASVILAYLTALAACNDISLAPTELVELCRQVENEYMGLNNGIQDQMSVAFGQRNALSLLDVNTSSARYVEDPDNIEEVSWVLCYSGFSRELVSSGFNDRVRECKEAAVLLDARATRLGDVAESARSPSSINALPAHLVGRAMHCYSEMLRVQKGADAWRQGHWQGFGKLMNQSCKSSIEDYECGSEPMVVLQNAALAHEHVYGSRFSGGGYGGCLLMLAPANYAEQVCCDVLESFLDVYPDKRGIAKTFIAQNESHVRLLEPR